MKGCGCQDCILHYTCATILLDPPRHLSFDDWMCLPLTLFDLSISFIEHGVTSYDYWYALTPLLFNPFRRALLEIATHYWTNTSKPAYIYERLHQKLFMFFIHTHPFGITALHSRETFLHMSEDALHISWVMDGVFHLSGIHVIEIDWVMTGCEARWGEEATRSMEIYTGKLLAISMMCLCCQELPRRPQMTRTSLKNIAWYTKKR